MKKISFLSIALYALLLATSSNVYASSQEDFYSQGIIQKSEGNYKYAYALFGKDNENPDSIYELATMNQYGMGCGENIEEAMKLYEKISQKNPYAANSLGVLHENEKGDIAKAREFYKLASSSDGCEIAKKNLQRINEEYPEQEENINLKTEQAAISPVKKEKTEIFIESTQKSTSTQPFSAAKGKVNSSSSSEEEKPETK